MVVSLFAESHCFTAFIDILGISDLIERNLPIARDKLSLFHEHINRFVADSPKGLSEAITFSDSVILVWEDQINAIEGCASLFSSIYDSNGPLYQQYHGDQYKYRAILLRGAISAGSLEFEKEMESGKSLQKFIIGSALSRSAKGESLVKGSRLLLLGDGSLKHYLLDDSRLSPKKRICNEVLWPLAGSRDSDIDRVKWILNLCGLYAEGEHSLLNHYRDTLWVIIRSISKRTDNEDLLLQMIEYIAQNSFIDLRNSTWLPIFLCIADIIHNHTLLKENIDKIIKLDTRLILTNASLKIMDNL